MEKLRAGAAWAIALATLTTGCASTGAVPKPFPTAGGRPRTEAPAEPATAAEPGRILPPDTYALVGTALDLRGVRYRNGGADPGGFDCSGFTQYVFAQHGVKLPRSVRDQYDQGTSVRPEDVREGDLLFFSTERPGVSHVAIAVGGDGFVHAPSSSGVVRVERMGARYWATRFVGARRVPRANLMAPYTRREFLGRLIVATSATRSIAPAIAQSPTARRVIVVGAGLAGLCAAYELDASGHDVAVLEAQTRPGGRVQTLRDRFDDGLFAEAGASRIPVSHDLTLGYARTFGLTFIPFEPVDIPSARYAYRQRSTIRPGAPFEWPSGIAADQKRLTPAEIRRRYIAPLVDEIIDPFSATWMPESLRQYDRVTRDEYLRGQGVSEAALHMMSLGYTPVARFRSFLDVLHENAVTRDLGRRSGMDNEQILKIEGGNDRLPRAFADRLASRIKYGCPVLRIEHDTRGARVFYRNGRSVESLAGGHVVCAVPFSALKSVAFSPALTPAKRSAINGLPYESVTRIYLQSRERYWTREGLSGFAETDHPMEIWDSTYGQPGTRGILMSYNRGPKAQGLGHESEAAQLRFGLNAIEEVFPGIRQHYERGVVKVWDRDPWAGGAIAYLRPGQVTSLQPHIARAEGRIHFAGEHASSTRGWMQGALESGKRVASEIAGL